MNYENILYEVKVAIALFTINRESKRNVLSLVTLDDINTGTEKAYQEE